MLVESTFDSEFLELACWRLELPIEEADLEALAGKRRRGQLFADAKLPSSDLAGARRLLESGFIKICVKIELHHDLRGPADDYGMSAGAVIAVDRLPLSAADIEAHAANFVTSRFRQDPRIPEVRARRLYVRWVANSLSGRKRAVAIGRNFCSFEDDYGVRTIDLLSVLEKRRGHAKHLLSELLADARRTGLREVHAVTEVENAAALSTYRSVGFEMFGFFTCFHLWAAATA